ncbi:hypothetical protein JVT61DRAFT_1152 [Boletus reticuloceps]|uniref:Uncharacterized protein n=1 Tax=Boletus reticuloceps TaxID=495285 RepID=A0A8I3A9R0_9AGAM|nr:hypothetical protein JVT61DRAFT_1152 [Boletus reticuloceps]
MLQPTSSGPWQGLRTYPASPRTLPGWHKALFVFLFSIVMYPSAGPQVPHSKNMWAGWCGAVMFPAYFSTLTIFLRVQGLFAHGIDVLRKTDFYSVSIRRNAFLTAAPQVAE